MSITPGIPGRGRRTTALAGVRPALAALRAYMRGVMGADAYERYVEHHRGEEAAGRCTEPAMSEREFWRDRTDRQDTDPQGRCC